MTNVPNVKSGLYYISDIAFAHIAELAREQEYVMPSATQRLQGISSFIIALADCHYEDTRPPAIRKAALEALEHSTLLRDGWTLQYPRRQRLLALPQLTINRYISLCNKFGVTPPNKPNALFAPLTQQLAIQNAFVAAILEAIGIEWLTPNHLPEKPFNAARRLHLAHERMRSQTNNNEIDW